MPLWKYPAGLFLQSWKINAKQLFCITYSKNPLSKGNNVSNMYFFAVIKDYTPKPEVDLKISKNILWGSYSDYTKIIYTKFHVSMSLGMIYRLFWN